MGRADGRLAHDILRREGVDPYHPDTGPQGGGDDAEAAAPEAMDGDDAADGGSIAPQHQLEQPMRKVNGVHFFEARNGVLRRRQTMQIEETRSQLTQGHRRAQQHRAERSCRQYCQARTQRIMLGQEQAREELIRHHRHSRTSGGLKRTDAGRREAQQPQCIPKIQEPTTPTTPRSPWCRTSNRSVDAAIRGLNPGTGCPST